MSATLVMPSAYTTAWSKNAFAGFWLQDEVLDLCHLLYVREHLCTRYDVACPEEAQDEWQIKRLDLICTTVAQRSTVISEQQCMARLRDNDRCTLALV